MARRRKPQPKYTSVTAASHGGYGGGGGSRGGGGGGGYSSPTSVSHSGYGGRSGGGGYSSPTSVSHSGYGGGGSRSSSSSSASRTYSPTREKEGTAQGRGPGSILARVMQGLTIPDGDEAFKDDIKRLIPDAVAASKKTGIPASVLLGLAGQESSYGTNQGPSTAGAQGVTQFIPATRESHMAKYGVDPWKNPKSGLIAAGQYLAELGFKADPQGALSSYSGGYAEGEYNNPILERAQAFSSLDKYVKGGKMPKGKRQLSTDELFYDPGISLDSGSEISPIGGHSDHVHYASQSPRDVLTAARMAQKRGLSVTENPAFGGVAPVHTTGSNHYAEQAIPKGLNRLVKKTGATGNTIGSALDISGDPDAMASLDRAIARRSGGPVLPSSGSFSSATAAVGSSAGGGYPAGSGYTSRDPSATARTTGRGGSSRAFSPAADILGAEMPDLAGATKGDPGSVLAQLMESSKRGKRGRRRLATR